MRRLGRLRTGILRLFFLMEPACSVVLFCISDRFSEQKPLTSKGMIEPLPEICVQDVALARQPSRHSWSCIVFVTRKLVGEF